MPSNAQNKLDTNDWMTANDDTHVCVKEKQVTIFIKVYRITRYSILIKVYRIYQTEGVLIVVRASPGVGRRVRRAVPLGRAAVPQGGPIEPRTTAAWHPARPHQPRCCSALLLVVTMMMEWCYVAVRLVFIAKLSGTDPRKSFNIIVQLTPKFNSGLCLVVCSISIKEES